jgi:hypothetical protein
VDDHKTARTTIRALLDWHSFQACGEAKNGKEAIEKVRELEKAVSERGGTYAMEDTDSMAIVATEKGGAISTGTKGKPMHALSWNEVKEISEQFSILNPYDRDAIPDSILKREDDNFEPHTKNQRQLFCLPISAKRYALFLQDKNGTPVLLRASCPFCGHKNKATAKICADPDCHKPIQVNNDEDRWSEHGLGHLLNPTDPESEDREWIAQAWLSIVRRALGLHHRYGALAKPSSTTLFVHRSILTGERVAGGYTRPTPEKSGFRKLALRRFPVSGNPVYQELRS